MSFRVEADQFRQVLADAKRFDRELSKSLRRELRAAAKPMAQAAKDAALALPSKGTGSTGLRRSLARSVTVQVSNSRRRAGVFIVAKASKMPAGQRTMPRAVRKGTWRHPVFGNRQVWVTQQGGDWFDGPISAKAPAAERAVKKALDDAERAIGFE